jgi:hypothetical protein
MKPESRDTINHHLVVVVFFACVYYVAKGKNGAGEGLGYTKPCTVIPRGAMVPG